ncbi:MAG: hypothetical protein RLZZ175_2471 [Bacteroidota bacterium]|jgi:hypothetical protein
MKKIFINVSILALAALSITSCRKDTDWNLNPAPTVTLDSVLVTPLNGVPKKIAAGNDMVVDSASSVKLFFSTSSKNGISQVSFHDGTWGGTMKLIAGTDTILATPPNSKYRPANTPQVLNYSITLPKIDSKTVFSMIVIDPYSMSTSYGVKLTTDKVALTK